jgi:hypothetical protein
MTTTMQQTALDVPQEAPAPPVDAKGYPLEIEPFGYEDELYGVYSKGHHGAGGELSGSDAFLKAARAYLLEEDDWDAKELDELLEAVGPSFQTWRCIPGRSYDGERLTQFVKAKPGSRGSFPVTVLRVDGRTELVA